MGHRFDFTPTLDVQNIEIPITIGLTTLHAEFTIDAPEDPPGRIVSIFGLRGNLTGKGRKKKRPLHFNFTQGQDGQARWEAEVTPTNEDGQERGPKMPFPGTYKIAIDWDAVSGVARANISSSVGSFSIDGPPTSPITNGFLYIGGHVSKPPAPGELPVYTTPLGCRLKGFVEFNGEQIDEGEDGSSTPPIEAPRLIDTLPPIVPPPLSPPPPISIPKLDPPIFQSPIDPRFPLPDPFPPLPSLPTSNLSSGFNFEAFPEFVSAAVAFYPELGKSLGQITPYIQAVQAGKKLASGGFNLSNPNDLIAVLQLINLFQNLR